MEKLLPYLSYLPKLPYLIIAIVIFRIYMRFRKELKKSRQAARSKPSSYNPYQPSQPYKPVKTYQSQTTSVANKPITIHFPKKEEAILIEEVFDPQHPYEPKYKPVYKKEAKVEKYHGEEKYKTMRPQVDKTSELVNPEEASRETKKNRVIHEPHKHRFEAYTEVEEYSEYADFDFRDAVIKSAILNRPDY